MGDQVQDWIISGLEGSRKWLIVSFTEQQVIQHTEECVNFIRRLSHDLCVSEQLIDLTKCEKLCFTQGRFLDNPR